MSRFQDFDEFLRTQASSQKKFKEELKEKIKKSRSNFDPFITDVFSLFKEYYETILLPRREFLMIPKKKESIEEIEVNHDNHPYFIYKINLIPKEILPGAFDPRGVVWKNHLTVNEVTDNDWHFDVSLQVNVSLFDSYDNNNTLTGNLHPRIWIRTWGKLPKEESVLLDPNISLTYATAWRLAYTEIQLGGNMQQLQNNLENTLMFLTSRVLAHIEEVWKIKK